MELRLKLWLFIAMICFATAAQAQHILDKKITIEVKDKKVADVFKIAEKEGGFYFSYNNNIINEDSIVSVSIKDKPLRFLLETLFGSQFLYQESNNHLIIQPNTSPDYWYVSGYIIDINTGEPVSYATVFEQRQLVGTMTDEHGFFKLQLKEKRNQSLLSISKLSYKDTSILMPLGRQDAVKIAIEQKAYQLDSIVISGVEQNWLARAFLSSKQTMNSLNLGSFFTKQPVQFSLTPGLGSHGSMGSQVVNKFSLNLLGGYTAGVKGFELGGLFNIDKGDMRYVQLAGLFNVVGGEIQGMQVAGLYNNCLQNMKGFQAAGLANVVMKDVTGVQVAGVYNYSSNMRGFQASGVGSVNTQSCRGMVVGGTFNVDRNMNGFQLAGTVNVTLERTEGVQVAGTTNFSMKEMNGLQLSGVLNYTRKLKGVQIGMVNIADSSDGYSIGFVNIVIHGYHKLSVSSSEWQHLSVAYKSGNAKLYSILLFGTQLDNSRKAYSYGYGLGSDRRIGKKGFYINPELTHQYIYNGNEANQNLLSRLQLNLKYRLGKYADIYAGPAFSVLYSKQTAPVEGYQYDLTNGYPSFTMGSYVTGWIGWNIGLDLF